MRWWWYVVLDIKCGVGGRDCCHLEHEVHHDESLGVLRSPRHVQGHGEEVEGLEARRGVPAGGGRRRVPAGHDRLELTGEQRLRR